QLCLVGRPGSQGARQGQPQCRPVLGAQGHQGIEGIALAGIQRLQSGAAERLQGGQGAQVEYLAAYGHPHAKIVAVGGLVYSVGQVLYREAAIMLVGRFDPAFQARFVGFVQGEHASSAEGCEEDSFLRRMEISLALCTTSPIKVSSLSLDGRTPPQTSTSAPTISRFSPKTGTAMPTTPGSSCPREI